MTFHDRLAPNGPQREDLPPAVQKLVGRELEIATLIYRRGASTAKEVTAGLSAPLSNSAVRNMLMRLVDKGVLTRCGGRRGGGACEAVYAPRTVAAKVRQKALTDLSEQYFQGSLLDLASTALRMLQLEAGRGQNRARD